ncbi:MAG: YihY/virulence factor BrkB family protein [Rhodospirillales bacterium]
MTALATAAVLLALRASAGAGREDMGWTRPPPDGAPPSPPVGRGARGPRAFDRRSWWAILRRVKAEMSNDNISIIAAGVAFYGLMAIFPGIAAAVALFGLLADPSTVAELIASMGGLLPGDAQKVLHEQLAALTREPASNLSFGALVAIATALWGAASGMKTIMTALNIAYEEDEKRGFFAFNLTALALTVSALVGALVALTAIVVVPPLLQATFLGPGLEWAIAAGRWPALGVLLMLALAFLYRFAPSRAQPKWRWATTGALAATVLWLAASGAFSWYVAAFGNYGATYGAVGGVVVLLMWLYISAFVVLMGAELNAEMEMQTARDTTTGPPQPMGRRRAYVADHVAG